MGNTAQRCYQREKHRESGGGSVEKEMSFWGLFLAQLEIKDLITDKRAESLVWKEKKKGGVECLTLVEKKKKMYLPTLLRSRTAGYTVFGSAVTFIFGLTVSAGDDQAPATLRGHRLCWCEQRFYENY